LDGITRRTVIELAEKRGYQVVQRTMDPAELAKTSEIFLTGTAAEVTPVGSIDDQAFTVGTISQTLMSDYENTVRGRTFDAAIAVE
jgi:branched-chain amino acid aminotransferase